jgi:predicted GH43/DUF377 family glycosyl hydrolase
VRWRKLGLVYCPDGSMPWAQAYAMSPTPLMLPDGRLRLFVACADASTVSRITYLDIDTKDPTKVLYTPDEPVLDVGEPGTFDDNGVNACSVIQLSSGRVRLYYVGYQLQRKIPYTLFTGVAEANESSEPFKRLQRTPVLDRSPQEAFFRTAPCVIRDADRWVMWYIGGGDWIDVGGKMQPIYSVRRVSSPDGIDWSEPSVECLKPQLPEEIGIGRPFVRRLGDGFEMYFSIRMRIGYRAGYATSRDGLTWMRCGTPEGLVTSPQGWDSEMICYGAVIDTPGGQLMYYNGNGYGRTGVGVCIRDD